MRRSLWMIVVFSMLFVSFGILMISTAGELQGVANYGNSRHFLDRQIMYLLPGAIAAVTLGAFNYRYYRNKWVLWFIIAAMVLLLGAVLTPAFGVSVKGSRRWLDLGAFRLQPSELVKLGVVIVLGAYMAIIEPRVKRWIPGFFVPVAILAVLVALVLKQPDFGCALIICGLGLMMLLAGGVRISGLIAVGLIGAVLIGALIWSNDNRRERMLDYLHGSKSQDEEAAYHLKQSQSAFRNGGPTGVGFGNSMQKYHYLPESHTDFIYAIVAEELGFAASIGLLLLFAAFLGSGFYIAFHAADKLGTLLAFGATVLIAGQAAANMSVVIGLLPTKGLALPFISYGGSNLIVALGSVGLIFNVGWQSLRAREEGIRSIAESKVREI